MIQIQINISYNRPSINIEVNRLKFGNTNDDEAKIADAVARLIGEKAEGMAKRIDGMTVRKFDTEKKDGEE
jgi:hypothetical protein